MVVSDLAIEPDKSDKVSNRTKYQIGQSIKSDKVSNYFKNSCRHPLFNEAALAYHVDRQMGTTVVAIS